MTVAVAIPSLPADPSKGAGRVNERERAWAPVVADRLLPEHIDGLLKQNIAYVLIPKLLSADWCAEITRRFLAFVADHPENRLQMRTSFIDTVVMPMNVFMRPDSGDGPSPLDEYFSRVPRDRPLLREIYTGGADPFELVRSLWQHTGWTELPAVENGRPYHTDVLWGLTQPSYAEPHIDTYHRDTPCSLSRFPRRFSCNTFIQRPDSGGDFRVHRHRREDGPFSADAGSPFAQYQVSAGDLLVFDSGHFHEVLQVDGDRHRLFSHAVAVLDPDSREYSLFA